MSKSPWNKGRIIGQKRPLKYLISGGSVLDSSWKGKFAT